MTRSGSVFLALLLTATASAAQAPPKDLFKGKVKAGMYEDKVEIDMGNVPGIPKDQAKQVQTHRRCMTQEQVDRGPASDQKGCENTNFKMQGDTATFTTICKDSGQKTDTRITPTAQGFNVEVKSTVTQGGQTFVSTMKGQSRWLGPCT